MLVIVVVIIFGGLGLLFYKVGESDLPIAIQNEQLKPKVKKHFSIQDVISSYNNLVSNRSLFKSTTLGADELMSTKELRTILKKKNDGIIMDGINKLKLEECLNICVCGGTGSGKTSSIIIPNLLCPNDEASYFVTDPSGEILEKTGHKLVKNGFTIKVLSFEGKHSLNYNPLARCNSSSEIHKVAKIIIDSNSSGHGNEQFWNAGAITILSLLITALKGDSKHCNLANIRYLLNKFDTTQNYQLSKFMMDSLDSKEVNEWEGVLQQDPKVLAGFVSTAKTSLNLLKDEHLAQLTSCDTLDLEQLRKSKAIIFVQFPENQTAYYAPLIKILYTQLFDMLMVTGRENQQERYVHIFLEEFANIGKIPNFGKYITTIRKRRANIVLIIQALEQVSALYGERAEEILSGGINTQLFLSGLSMKTCEMLSKVMGNTTIQGNNGGIHQRRVLTATEIRLLDNHHGVFLHHNKKPAIIKMRRYYEHRQLSTYTKQKYYYFNSVQSQPLAFIELSSKKTNLLDSSKEMQEVEELEDFDEDDIIFDF